MLTCEIDHLSKSLLTIQTCSMNCLVYIFFSFFNCVLYVCVCGVWGMAWQIIKFTLAFTLVKWEAIVEFEQKNDRSWCVFSRIIMAGVWEQTGEEQR